MHYSFIVLRFSLSMKRLFVLLSCLLPSALRVRLLRRCGAQIGRGVRLGLLSIIRAESLILADGASIAPLCLIHARNVHIGKRARVGSVSFITTGLLTLSDDAAISKFVVVTGGPARKSELYVGKRSWIFPFCVIDTTCKVHLDDEVGVGGGSFIFTHGSWLSKLEGFPVDFGPVVVERSVWLPWRTFITPNVTIGQQSIVSGGSVVQRNIAERSLASGVPARVMIADGNFIMEVSRSRQIEMVRETLLEVVADFEYERKIVSVNLDAEHFQLIVDGQTIVFRECHCQAPDAAICISLDELPLHVVHQIERNGGAWMELGKRRCSSSRERIYIQLKNHFSKHLGLRFAVMDRADPAEVVQK
jgi:acetyltransferase-like isoleucine patch superfamily enzyme